mgnify:FL=1
MNGKTVYNGVRDVARLLFVILAVTTVVTPAVSDDVAAPAGSAYRILPGDILEISVWKEPDLQRSVLVRPDGRISFPLAGELVAAGQTVASLHDELVSKLVRYIPDPVVLVTVEQIQGNKIYVLGQVNDPGVFTVNPQVDVMQALSMAGGTTAFASLNSITILRRDGEVRRSIPFRYEEVVKGRNLEQNIILQSGDVVVVP